MELVQYNGPFNSGDEIKTEVRYDYTVVHIGIQIPKRQPIAAWKSKEYSPDLTINGNPYAVNENGILEFDGTSEISFTVKFNKTLPPETILDVIYKSTEE